LALKDLFLNQEIGQIKHICIYNGYFFIHQVSEKEQGKYKEFIKINKYCSGQYDKTSDFGRLDKMIADIGNCNRLFYLALPPSVYETVTLNIKAVCMSKR
jgi:glucose-6-phosphate 1-dehydrogenase